MNMSLWGHVEFNYNRWCWDKLPKLKQRKVILVQFRKQANFLRLPVALRTFGLEILH